MKEKQRSANKIWKILAVAQDPGGVEAILPVIKKLLKKSNVQLKIFTEVKGGLIFIKEGIKCSRVDNCSLKELDLEFKKINPDLTLTATSHGFSVEKKFLRLAKKYHISTVSIIDYWSNYWLRFVCEGEKKSVDYLPDKIIVVDALMKKQMIAEGFPSQRIKIFGNPHFETFTAGTYHRIEHKNSFIVLFISQPLRDIYKNDKNFKYDEHRVSADILRIFKKIKKGRITIIIRPHPLEDSNKYFGLLKIIDDKIDIKIDDVSPIDKLLKKADLVLGMSSSVLFRSSLMGIPTISYQPQLDKKNDTLAFNILKLSVLSCDEDDLERQILFFLNKDNISGEQETRKKNINKYVKSGATKKTIDLIFKMLNRSLQ